MTSPWPIRLARPGSAGQMSRRRQERQPANVTGGSVRFDELSRYATPDLAYMVELERTEVQLADSGATVRISLRVTTIFRREGDTWNVAHRHADPITTDRPISTIVES